MKRVVMFCVFVSLAATAQKNSNSHAETFGTCSPVVQGNEGKVVFTCNATVDAAARKKILTLLNAILKNTNDQLSTNKKLDDVLEYLSQLQPSVSQGSGSIAQIGGAGNSATVNNFAPPTRRILNQKAFIDCLRTKPGKFSISAIMNNSEAYNYAKDWRDVLVDAGWEVTHKDIPIQIYMMGGGMWAGTKMGMHAVVDGKREFINQSPEQNLYNCLMSVPIGANLQVTLNSKAPSGVVDIVVSDHE